MLVDIQLIGVPTGVLPLHHILSQYLRNALGVFDGLPSFDAAVLEASVLGEGLACQFTRGYQSVSVA